jgi:hypothetical protein
VDGDASAPILNFGTQPTWLYSPDDFSYPENNSVPWYGYDRGSAAALNATGLDLLGDYYGRVMSWYTRGRFVDEYGKLHTGGYFLNVSLYEVTDHFVFMIFYVKYVVRK